jgi:hypothetical protein
MIEKRIFVQIDWTLLRIKSSMDLNLLGIDGIVDV